MHSPKSFYNKLLHLTSKLEITTQPAVDQLCFDEDFESFWIDLDYEISWDEMSQVANTKEFVDSDCVAGIQRLRNEQIKFFMFSSLMKQF